MYVCDCLNKLQLLTILRTPDLKSLVYLLIRKWLITKCLISHFFKYQIVCMYSVPSASLPFPCRITSVLSYHHGGCPSDWRDTGFFCLCSHHLKCEIGLLPNFTWYSRSLQVIRICQSLRLMERKWQHRTESVLESCLRSASAPRAANICAAMGRELTSHSWRCYG